MLTAALVLGSGPIEADATPATTEECDPEGPALRYLVVFERRTSDVDATTGVDTACGELETYHPEIAVGVATSTDDRFADRLGPHRAFSSGQA